MESTAKRTSGKKAQKEKVARGISVQEALQSLQSKKRPKFKSVPHYNRLGDFLSVFFSDTPTYAERVDDVLTVYRSMTNHELVGCKIKGVSLLAENVSNLFRIEDDQVEIQLLLLNAIGPKMPQHFYYELGAKFGSMKIPLKQMLQNAA